MLIIQATTLSGMNVEGARWEADLPWVQEGHTVSIDMPIRDSALIGYVGKRGGLECFVDKEGGKFSVSMSCKVMRIRHMVRVADRKAASATAESLVIVAPANRLVEGVMLYMLQPSKCDPRFVAAVRGPAAPPREQPDG